MRSVSTFEGVSELPERNQSHCHQVSASPTMSRVTASQKNLDFNKTLPHPHQPQDPCNPPRRVREVLHFFRLERPAKDTALPV